MTIRVYVPVPHPPVEEALPLEPTAPPVPEEVAPVPEPAPPPEPTPTVTPPALSPAPAEAPTTFFEKIKTFINKALTLFLKPIDFLQDFWTTWKIKQVAKTLLQKVPLNESSEVFITGPVEPGTIFEETISQESALAQGRKPVKLQISKEPGNYYIFFIDDEPGMKFAHPVRYAWLNKKTGQFEIFTASAPMKILDANENLIVHKWNKFLNVEGVPFFYGPLKKTGLHYTWDIRRKDNAVGYYAEGPNRPPNWCTKDGPRALKAALVIDGGGISDDAISTDKDVREWQAGEFSGDADRLVDEFLKKYNFPIIRISQDGQNELPYINVDSNRAPGSRLPLEDIFLVLKEFFSDPPKGGCHELFIYYTGHGTRQGLEIYSADGSGVVETTSYGTLLRLLNTLPKKKVWVTIFIDACHSGAIFTGGEVSREEGRYVRNSERIAESAQNLCGLRIITATDEDSSTPDGKGLTDSATEDFLEKVRKEDFKDEYFEQDLQRMYESMQKQNKKNNPQNKQF